MSAPPFMPLYVGDYLGDTTHLTCTEHGAYLLLLMCMWRSNGSLPENDKNLARFAHCTALQWARMKPIIMPFFTVESGMVTHRRLTRELTKHAYAVERQRVVSSNGGKAKALKYKKPDGAFGTSTACQPEPEPDISEAKASSIIPAQPKKAVRLSSDWTASGPDRSFARTEGLTEQEIDRATDSFRDYWCSRSGREAAKLDWSATWRNWVRRTHDDKRKRGSGLAGGARTGGGGPGVVDFASIIAGRERLG